MEECREANIEELKGKTLIKIEGMQEESEKIIFYTKEGKKYLMNHQQSCCEYVRLEDIVGNCEDLIGKPLLMCEEEIVVHGYHNSEENGTSTWYKFATVNGYVTLRWLGESNGYYSESVDFSEIVNK